MPSSVAISFLTPFTTVHANLQNLIAIMEMNAHPIATLPAITPTVAEYDLATHVEGGGVDTSRLSPLNSLISSITKYTPRLGVFLFILNK